MIELKNLTKTYKTKAQPKQAENVAAEEFKVEAVRDVSLKMEKGDIFGIIGLSGAGKSTLVRCINFIERPTSGEVVFEGINLGRLGKRELLLQRRRMSMIFQSFNLLSQRTALKNICYPLEIAGVSKKDALKRARELLELVGLTDRANAYPSQLSGGQQQRVAIARALATNPQVLLCDEATSALDPTTTRSILDLLKKINETMGVTIIVITHEMKVVEQICNRVAVMDNGEVVETGAVKDVFFAPKSQIAKQLILPKSESVSSIKGGKVIRILFDGRSAFEPVISNLSLECHTAVNILKADTTAIDGKAVGEMIIQLPDNEESEKRVLAYFDRTKLHYEEVTSNV